MESAWGTILDIMVRKGFLEEVPKQRLGGSKPAKYVQTVCRGNSGAEPVEDREQGASSSD